MDDKKRAKLEEKEAKKRAKFQTKIDKLAPQIQEMDRILDDYYNAFMADGEIDTKEMKQLEKLKKKIAKVESKIASLKAKMGTNNGTISSNTQNEDLAALKDAKIKELKAIKAELEDMLKSFHVS